MPFDANDPDTKAAIKEAVAAAVEEAKGPLDAKNKELLAELKEARKGRQVDPAEVERLEGKIEDLTTKLAAAEKTATEATKAAEKAAKALETETGFTSKLLGQDGLKSAMLKGGVKDEDFIDALVSKFSPGVKIVTEGDTRKAMIGDKDVDTTVSEFLKSDAGKKFVAAPTNGGGGAGGGKGGGGAAKTMTREAFGALSPSEKAQFSKDGGELVDANA